MTITVKLHPEHEAWIAAAVARGEFASAEEAAQAAVAHGIASLELRALGDEPHEAEIARINALLDEADAAAARGEVITAEDAKAFMAAEIESFRR